MRILVTGGRHFPERPEDQFLVEDTLAEYLKADPELMIIVGCADGADYRARQWARNARVSVSMHTADWRRHGKAAGPMRNKAMLSDRPDMVLAFPGGIGTENMISQAKKAGIRVRRVLSLATRLQPQLELLSSP